jgi:putative flippase GtrA
VFGRGRLPALVRRLRSPESGLLGQGLRYAISGGIVGAVYVIATLLFSHVLGLPFQVALLLGFVIALATHFTLQRMFVWVHREEFALSRRHQARRYLVVALAQYGVTALITATVPDALGVSTELVYLATTASVTVANFVIFRTRVFHTA